MYCALLMISFVVFRLLLFQVRLQAQHGSPGALMYNGIWDCIFKISKEEGVCDVI